MRIETEEQRMTSKRNITSQEFPNLEFKSEKNLDSQKPKISNDEPIFTQKKRNLDENFNQEQNTTPVRVDTSRKFIFLN